MSKSIIRSALALVGLALLPGAAAAQGIIEPDMRWPRDPAIQRISSDVTIRVDGARRIAHVEVEELFRNRSSVMLEGDYLYPIPVGAVFTDFSLYMGETELKGEVLPAEEARRIYEEIVRRKKDPALIELVGHGVLRSRVFPIEPGATRRVILRYTQVLGRDGRLVRVKYPRIVGNPPGAERRERVAPQRPQRHPFTLQINVEEAERYATPYSPTHTIDVRERRGELEISHQGDGSARDFELFLPMRESFVGASVVTHAPAGEDGYFMLVISPPEARDLAEIPRDLTLVLDVSGSMSGEKLEQARAALGQVLAGLREGDRFRLITFSSVVRRFRRDFAPATRENIAAARDYLEGVRAEGSTNVADALRDALEPPAGNRRLSLVVFLTDGKPTVGETSPERIAELAESLRDGERVFTFGVGHDVNTYLLDRMARGGHGSVSYVRPGEDVEAAVSSLTRKIGYPALADLELAGAPALLEDYYPHPIPDLFAGEELVIFGRYREHGSGELVIEGTRAGERVRLTYDDVEFPRREVGNAFMTKLWAARKAGALTAQIRLNGANAELVEEIRQLGLRYGILTEYSSYLVEEPQFALGDDERRQRDLLRAQSITEAPAEQSGEAAFTRSEESARLSKADRMAELEPASVPGRAYAQNAASAPRIRHVGRRLFVERAGTWTDVEVGEGLEVVEVAAFSEAYFAVLNELPALRPYLALGDRLLIGGDGLALRIDEDGRTHLGRRQLNRLVAALEGTL